ASSGGPIRIGMSFDSLQFERWQHDRAAFVARAKELSADGAVALDMLGRKRSA
ncbi:MAG: D-xylose transporter subunit XylF, partial [Acidobacteria bacterium]